MKEWLSKDILFDYLDGNLSPEEQRKFEEQLAKDESLRLEVEAQRKLSRLLASAPRPQPDPNLRRQIREHLQRETLTPRAVMQNRVYRIAQMAALIAIVLVAVQIYRMSENGQPEADEYPQAVSQLELKILAEPEDDKREIAMAEPKKAAPVIKATPDPTPAAATIVEEPDLMIEAETPREIASAVTPIPTPLDLPEIEPLLAERIDATPTPPTEQFPYAEQSQRIVASATSTPEPIRIEPLPDADFEVPEPTPNAEIAFIATPPVPTMAPQIGAERKSSGGRLGSMANRLRQIPGISSVEEKPAAAPRTAMPAQQAPRGEVASPQDDLRSRALRSLRDDAVETPLPTPAPHIAVAPPTELFEVPEADGAVALIARQRAYETDAQTFTRVQGEIQNLVQKMGGRVHQSRTRMLDGRRIHEMKASLPADQAQSFPAELQQSAGFDYRRALNNRTLGRVLERNEAIPSATQSGIAFYERHLPAEKSPATPKMREAFDAIAGARSTMDLKETKSGGQAKSFSKSSTQGTPEKGGEKTLFIRIISIPPAE